GAVANHIFVLADIDISVRVPDLDSDAVRERLDCGRNGSAVESRSLEGETDSNLAPVRPAVVRREVAIDSMVDPVVLGADVDRFGGFERAVALNLNVAKIFEDALVGLCSRWS